MRCGVYHLQNSYRTHRTSLVRRSPPGKHFVMTSLTFVPIFLYAVNNLPHATDSRTQWYAIGLLFFLSCDSGAVVFEITDWLSPNKYDGPDNGTPIIRNLYRSPLSCSVATFIATNSDPNVEVLTEFWCFECHTIGAMFMYVIIPVYERRVSLSPA
jgi:hypothetical protein